MANMDKEMYDTWQRLLREDGHLRGTDFFAFRLGWLECKAAQHHAHPTPESLASSQAVVNASALEQSDSVPPPAQAQVA